MKFSYLFIFFFNFITDTSSTTRILPLVHPSNLQITSRGRVVFNILRSGQMGGSLNDVTSYISFLPPEYLSSIGKKIAFIESDVEKVFIFSHLSCILLFNLFSLRLSTYSRFNVVFGIERT